MATSSIANKSTSSFKWFSNKNSSSSPLRLSLPLFRPSKSKSNSQTNLFPNSSWPRKSRSKDDEILLQQVFGFFDENKDGRISVEELRGYFVSVGDSISHEEAAGVIKEFDKDGDNLLELDEFVEMIDHRDDQDEEQDDDVVKKAFEMFEVEKGSGCITPKGLQQVLKRLGSAKSFDECRAMIRVFDLDGNGVLDLYEFQRMMS